MKTNIFIIHSLNRDTLEFWGQDVIAYFKAKHIEVFAPEFPIRAESSYEKFDTILKKYLNNGFLNENSIVVAHSIGNPYFIRFCERHKFSPKVLISVAPGAVYDYPRKRNDYIIEVSKQANLKNFELEYAKKSIKDIILFYSDEDDGNIEKFTRFIEDTGATPIYLKGYNHFDGYHRIYKIPELLCKIDEILLEDTQN